MVYVNATSLSMFKTDKLANYCWNIILVLSEFEIIFMLEKLDKMIIIRLNA